MNASVSIIVPVYNAEKYIGDCVKSVIAQTYRNWELLLVDDGSVDSSAHICKEYALLDSRIKFYTKENGGVGSARNFGIEKASGEYIMFLDSDDYWDESCLDFLMGQNDIPDMTVFAFSKVRDGVVSDKKVLKPVASENPEQSRRILLDMKADAYTSDAFCFPWNKLFKASLIKEYGIRFPLDIRLREDEIFMYRYLRVCKSVKILHESLHFYRITQSGLTCRKRPCEEDMRLGAYILSETKLMECTREFFNRQETRALLYYFSAFMNSPDKLARKHVFSKMKMLHSSNSNHSVENERLIGKLVVRSLVLPAWLGFPLMGFLGFLWRKKMGCLINV